MSTAEYPDALTRRIELLAAASSDEPEGESSAVAALVGSLRAEIGAVRAELGSLRSETGAVRGDLDGLGGRLSGSVAAGRSETGARLDALAGTMAAALDREARAAEGTTAALEDARVALESRLAALEDALDGTSERIEALSRDGASTTTATLLSLEGGVAALGRKLQADGQETADRVVGQLREATETGLSGLEAALLERLSGVLQVRDDALRGQVSAALETAREQAAQDRAALTELVLGAVSALQADQVARDAAAAARLDGLQRSVEDVTGRVGDLHDAVVRGVDATTEALTGLSALSGSTDALAQTVDGFRTEWPTRTHEVVQGARAVADGVVRQVRAEVGDQLERVRSELDRAAGGVDAARAGLEAGTDRLSQAGAVLVAYLEQRDRLLEAERDAVLHDVLDTFAAGLSARDRAALTGRVGDAVARRRDGRDAERYRAAVGTPVSPTTDLPEEVRRLAEVGPARQRPVEPAPPAEPSAPVAQDEPATPAAPVRAVDVSTPRVALPRVAATRGASGTSVTVRPTASPATPAGVPAPVRSTPARPVEAAAPAYSPDRRARVDVMPQVRSPAVALEAAAPTPAAPTPATPTPAAPTPAREDRQA